MESQPLDDEHRARADEIRAGGVLAAARTISDIERGAPAVRGVLALLYPSCGGAHLVGVTGPPGAGKSTLVAGLITEYRSQDLSVGVVAVDPSSPYSGGALLGDRDRMLGSALDAGVFIRSLAARGASGGLANAVNDVVDVMDAMGKDVIIIETVGVGQGELDVASIAHTVVLTLVPGYGDALQAMKAGITEIADVVAMNKSDVPGAEAAAAELRDQGLVRQVPGGEPWPVPVVMVSARRHEGVDALVKQIAEHRAHLLAASAVGDAERDRRASQFLDAVVRRLERDLRDGALDAAAFRSWIDRLDTREVDPGTAAAGYVEDLARRLER